VKQPKVAVPDSLGWDADVNAGLNLSQTAYSNWTKGGESALAWTVSNSNKFIYNAANYIIAVEGTYLYGKTKIGGNEARKSEDRIDMEFLVQNKKPIVSLFSSVRGETQFDVGKKYMDEDAVPVSNFIDPLYLFQSAGLIYNYKENFQARLGASFKQTITRNFPFWSDDKNTPEKEKVRYERGLESMIEGNITIMENLNYSTEVKVFSTLESLRDTDVEFDNILTAKVNKYVVVNFHYYMIYDRDASLKAQIFEGLALGLSFNLW
jgi:hypothetical protein